MAQFSQYPDVISIDQLREMLNIGRNAAYKLIQDGTIQTVRAGKRYIIPKRSVIEFINKSEGKSHWPG